MSEQAPERPTRGQAPQGKPGSAKRGLTKKIGPLPLWAWGGLAIGGALAFYFAKGPGKSKPTPTAQPTGQASANPTSLASNYPGLGFPTALPTTTGTGTTSATTSTGTTSATTGTTSDEGPGDKDKGPGGKGKTGGWKGQHSNGQGSHHGGPNPPPAKKGPPRRVNPGGPIRRKVNVPPKA